MPSIVSKMVFTAQKIQNHVSNLIVICVNPAHFLSLSLLLLLLWGVLGTLTFLESYFVKYHLIRVCMMLPHKLLFFGLLTEILHKDGVHYIGKHSYEFISLPAIIAHKRIQ